MEQESIFNDIAIVGAGAAGAMAAVLLSKNPYNKVTLFDLKEPFSTLLPTGGGRCNITNSLDDIREFVKNYPRGEKFLLSVFSKFDQYKTRELFKDLGVKTYVQPDGRVFPVSDSSKKTIERLNEHLKSSNVLLKKEKVISVQKQGERFVINGKYEYKNVIIATGGKGNGFELARSLGHRIIEPRPSLFAIDIKEKELYNLSGLSFKNIEASSLNGRASGDILFTHKSISGPCIFKIAALNAFEEFNSQKPLEITLKLTDYCKEEIESYIKENSKKSVKNVFSAFAPENFILAVCKMNNIDPLKQTAQLKKTEKADFISALTQLKIHATGRIKDSEIVTAGGVDLNEINPKTMESKIVKGLYFIGEVLNIDAFTGGFNLQNCWSGAYLVSSSFN